VKINSPSDAIQLGIGMVHQHFMLVPSLTVAENVAMGLQTTRRGLLNLAPVTARIHEISTRYGLKVDPGAYVWQLSVGEQQRIEIIKALYRNATVLILDEPTAVLTPQEVIDLFKILRQMKADGHAIVFISHKLGEVLSISDQITVLRDGRVVGTLPTENATQGALVNLMVGREVSLQTEYAPAPVGNLRLRLTNLCAQSDRKTPALKNVSLEIRAGEILGLAGVSGNGQRELAQVIAGLRPATTGSVWIDEQDVSTATARGRFAVGLRYVPEERMRDGAIRDFDLAENSILHTHAAHPISRYGVLNFRAIRTATQSLIDTFTVKTPNQQVALKTLSGGNIQKLIIARELADNPHVLIAAQPTRGVDVGATLYIHQVLLAQRAEGTATLLISEDLDEIMSLSDRIAVIYEGEIRGILPRGEATAERLGLLMAGVRESA
jgi:simple sugar transport system ATP-binding protein